MPTVLLTEDFTDEQTGFTHKAGTSITLHPSSPVYARLIDEGKAEGLIPLPPETPGYTKLMKAGITTLQALFGLNDITSVKGIGGKTADDIIDFVQKLNSNQNKGE